MTLDEFLTELEKTPRKWELARGGRIRIFQKLDCYCPIIAVCLNMGFDSRDSGYALKSGKDDLKLADKDAARIVNAADNFKGYKRIRARLLKACGLAS